MNNARCLVVLRLLYDLVGEETTISLYVPSSRCSVHECSLECHGVRFPSSEHDCPGIAGSSR